MGSGMKIATGVIALAMITTAVLPGRLTAPVLKVFFDGSRGILATAMGTGKQV